MAAALRLYSLVRWPPGLYHDEAFNGLDALHVIDGQRPVFFEANNGREPLFIYLAALSVSVFGRSPFALRFVAAMLGTLTIPAAYATAREWLGRRVALLSALLTGITFWHLNLSRVGFRAVSLPLLAALCVWFVMRALRRNRLSDFAVAGVFLGLSMYAYLAARFLPIVLGAWIAYKLWRGQRINRQGWILLLAVALLTALPLLAYAVQHVQVFVERAAQVSIFNPAIHQGDPWGTWWRHLSKTLLMFNWRGDFIPRHNLPYRPVFDPAMGVFFLLGVGVSLHRASRQDGYGLLLIYVAVMLLPTTLAEDAPHFLRAVGVLPVLLCFPAVGVEAFWHTLQTQLSKQVAWAAIALLLGLSLSATVRDYFVAHVQSEAVYYNFEAGAAELAAEVNRFVSTSWPGESATGMIARESPGVSQRKVYLDERLWKDWASLRYLIPDTEAVELLREETAGSAPSTADRVLLVVWPYADYQSHLRLLPTASLISVREGPLERGDLEKEARLLCLLYEAAPAHSIARNLQAQFERGIELLGYEWSGSPDRRVLRLYWQARAAVDANYTVFVHWRRGDQMVAQDDAYPARGYYPTHLWRPGDTVVDDHPLFAAETPAEGDSISVGLYALQTMTRLQVLDDSGGAVADHVRIEPR